MINEETMIADAIDELRECFTIAEIWHIVKTDHKVSLSDYKIRKYLKEWCRHDSKGVWCVSVESKEEKC